MQTHLAVNYSKIGRSDEALLLLESCLREESNKKNATATIGWLYNRIGRIHHRRGDYTKAHDFYNIASSHITEPKDLFYNLFYKAEVLLAQNELDECIRIIEKGLAETSEFETATVLFNALKHSLYLNVPTSLEYMETIALPKLIEYGQHLTAIEYLEKLSAYFGENRKHKKAAYYYHWALTLCKQLMEGKYDYEETRL